MHTDDRQQFGFSTTDPSTPSNWTHDSWSDKEKSLLENGLDLFGHSWVRLSQFIGTKSSHQVKTYVRSHLHRFGGLANDKYAQTSFSSESGHCSTGILGFTELIDDMQIPASMEEVIAVVSTAQPTVPSVPRWNVVTNSTVSQCSTAANSGEFRRRLNVHNDSIKGKSRRGRSQVLSKLHVTKRSSKVNHRSGRKQGFHSNVHSSNTKICHVGKLKQQIDVGGRDFGQEDSSSVASNCQVSVVLSAGEEVVRIQKERSHDSDEDDEIEIEECANDVNVLCPVNDDSAVIKNIDIVASRTPQASLSANKISLSEIQKDHSHKMDINNSLSDDSTCNMKIESKKEGLYGEDIDVSEDQQENTHGLVLVSNTKNLQEDLKEGLSELSFVKDSNEERETEKGTTYSLAMSHQDILESIFNLPPPNEELILDVGTITEEEKVIHSEFFEGRVAKTPKRYLKIRNHILECWQHSRPTYVTKTSVRTGLKNCGDVNCIGRIHAYLEQIGAINFGCEQTRYTRPLYLMSNAGGCESVVASAGGSGRERVSKEQLAAQHQARIDAMRPRKKKHIQDSWFPVSGEGGYTITHSEDGEAIHTTFVMPDSHKNTSKVHMSKPKPIKLIYCNRFTESKPAPYSVELHIEPLLIMDIHAHSSHSEVIGLLGGSYDPKRLVLQIWRAVACRSSSSGIHCDMCPVSQTEASERLHDEGLEVVGWYHSHPTFSPNPSLQDLDTQGHMQEWFAKTASAPLVGFILSPYCPENRTSASEYRCLIVEPNDELTNIPYRLTVNVISDELNTSMLLRRMDAIIALHEESSEATVNFNTEFSSEPPLTYLEKCVESTRQHLKSCIPFLPKEVEEWILRSVLQVCNTLVVLKQTKSELIAEKHG
ncbi:histone H2A deubiquitinase MYSM1-like isoform X2 [Zootermopsis nevadensis]|nr:histone H2A deubiquitinase MYSM1-like isoform X2 [Zootermopsis nevadensis]